MSLNRYLNAFLTRVRTEPDSIFLKSIQGKETKDVSFSEFAARVKQAVAGLVALEVSRGDVVLVFSVHGADALACFLACQAVGAIPSFMPPPTPRQDLEIWQSAHNALCRRIEPKLVVCDEANLGAVSQLDAQVAALATIFAANGVAELAVSADETDIAFLQHSSGTTGLKKGVMVSYEQLIAQVESYATSIPIDASSNTVVTWLPIYHDMGLIAATLLPIYLGMPIVSIETFTWLANPGLFIEWLSKSRAPVAWLPNFAFKYLAMRVRQDPSLRLDNVHAIVNCSEPCKLGDMVAFSDRFVSQGLSPSAIRVCYAMAEYVFAVTQTPVGRQVVKAIEVDADAMESTGAVVIGGNPKRTRKMVSTGTAIEGVLIRVNSNDGGVGEIEISGPSLCLGYYRNEQLSSQKFVDGWYKTGDLGFIHDGELYIAGRMDDLIIVRGKNIYAHDVEAAVTLTGKVKPGRCVTFGVEDDRNGSQSLVVAAETANASPLEVTRAINDIVSSEFGISPSDIVVLEENTLVKTTSGKISRSENAARYRAGTLLRWSGV
ncbi:MULTISPECIES: AMP-binding protein [unclassified Ensifer]|uniref:AMP-binding protein n=1 Tax=unclassified Ensifer TaxID=2633371 RepID=UPI00070C610E|nr:MULTISPECIES: AMP-binding protein [unclassified Ensifer]KQW62854.1 hypothetical protein ASD02_01660 [Ensifer sp. Root1252]KRC83675.1 hypothetical protein ASE32_01650 [Ensifer sp. Root231]KRD04028.1 hypothetical protein ASE47_00310 [Ensifer sp. Root258]